MEPPRRRDSPILSMAPTFVKPVRLGARRLLLRGASLAGTRDNH
jgi:hypothetical protein